MANKIVKTVYGAPEKQILIAEDSYKVTLGAIIGNAGVQADTNGKKIIKAGSPLYGSYESRGSSSAFDLATETPESEGTPASNNATAILLHDLDVTAGDENGTIVIAGVVDLNKLDSSVQTLLTTAAKANLKHIIFIK